MRIAVTGCSHSPILDRVVKNEVNGVVLRAKGGECNTAITMGYVNLVHNPFSCDSDFHSQLRTARCYVLKASNALQSYGNDHSAVNGIQTVSS